MYPVLKLGVSDAKAGSKLRLAEDPGGTSDGSRVKRRHCRRPSLRDAPPQCAPWGALSIYAAGVLPRGQATSRLGPTMNTPPKPRHEDRIQYFAERYSPQDLQALFELEQANAELIRALEAAEARMDRERTKKQLDDGGCPTA